MENAAWNIFGWLLYFGKFQSIAFNETFEIVG